MPKVDEGNRMNNTIKSLENGDFEVLPLDDEKAIEFHKKREESLAEYRKQAMELWNDSCTAPRKCEWDDWKPIK